MVDLDKDWFLFLTRPFSLLGVSLWYQNYNHSLFDKFGCLPSMLFVEEFPGIVRRFVVKEEFDSFNKKIKGFVRDNPEECEKILSKGLEINDQLAVLLDGSSMGFREAVDFFSPMMFYTTFMPYFILSFDDSFDKAKQLRSVSYFPRFLKEILVPAGKRELGVDVSLLTVGEALAGKVNLVEERKRLRDDGFLFVHQILNDKEEVDFVQNPGELVSKLLDVKPSDAVSGSIAFSGKAKGHARFVFGTDPNVPFDKGDILVSICTNPSLVPLFHKASAVVTDEGGIMSHAAILCRELKIPCVVGTKIATKLFKDGDLLEVDAEKGIIKKIK